ncbi:MULTISPECIES: signal peptidase [Paraburkholderia]|uniref:Signal peptidase n=1 Tax=Paraburkholderia megapolitana TaxID=420953 RepID=A0A1I3J5B9_9BURK|nr:MULTISPECIES: signal peptidase [Paraburkholderia]MCX4160837.1 signal peptidase [Paraburkholderia megapolitana]MDN7156334.1 signal peptidase [Paraburkholderia sp. CHISQ3]MDQ6493379.1 signal peptidase [Paraburkholderia megapolitana]QDQ84924.1 signal peptidase [Paraburkholderia megapolitana]SFI55457.1 hypothetical protein SAMN05192543_103565 [Paraburkholderia megapolitana]
MKIRYAVGMVIVAAITQTGCATHVRSLPLQAKLTQPDASSAVALYFGSQTHEAVKTQLGEVTASARIARKVDDEQVSCDTALNEALHKLRDDAGSRHANAVINIRTSFHSTETEAADTFTCGVSGSAAALHVRGDAVTLEQ